MQKLLLTKFKTRNATLPILFNTVFGSLSHSNQTRKRNKRNSIGKEEVKLSLFSDDMILYIRKSTKNN